MNKFGIEPKASAKRCKIKFVGLSERFNGEHGWNRTNDNLIKSEVLYRLSYVLVKSENARNEHHIKIEKL